MPVRVISVCGVSLHVHHPGASWSGAKEEAVEDDIFSLRCPFLDFFVAMTAIDALSPLNILEAASASGGIRCFSQQRLHWTHH